MMFAVVYLSAKLGRVTSRGSFRVLRDNYSPWMLWPALIGVLIVNVIEAAAMIGTMAATIDRAHLYALLISLGNSVDPYRCIGSRAALTAHLG
jgi:Mn2+/Fe2+ NRAMP family transporter